MGMEREGEGCAWGQRSPTIQLPFYVSKQYSIIILTEFMNNFEFFTKLHI